MKCIKCGKQAKISLQNLEACEKCFQKIIEKRVRKEIRINNLIQKGDKILIIDDSSLEAIISEYLLRKITNGLPIEIEKTKTTYNLGKEIKANYNKIIIPWNADKEAEYFLFTIFENRKLGYLGHYKLKNKTYIKLLLPILKQEIEQYCKIKKIKFKKEQKQSMILAFINKLEGVHPEVKFSLLKSSREIKKII